MTDKSKLELQVTVEVSHEPLDAGPPPNTRSHDSGHKAGSHDPEYRMGSTISVELYADDGEWVGLLIK